MGGVIGDILGDGMFSFGIDSDGCFFFLPEFDFLRVALFILSTSDSCLVMSACF